MYKRKRRLRQRKCEALFVITTTTSREDQKETEKREAEIPVSLSMWPQWRAICVKRAIYFSRSRRECPRRNFGREESDAVSLSGVRPAGESRLARRGTAAGARRGAIRRGGGVAVATLDSLLPGTSLRPAPARCTQCGARHPNRRHAARPSPLTLFAQKENSRCGRRLTH